MVKRSNKTNTGEGDKGKKSRTVSDDSGGKSLSDTSTSAGVKSTSIRTSVNIFESSGDYIKKKTEEVLLTLGIVKVGDDDGLFKKVADNGSNMVKGWNSLGCLDHTIERSVMKLWNDASVL